MKIFIAGATGVLGRRLIKEFRTRGHSVIGLARSDANERTIQALGGEPRRADLFDSDSLARAAEGSEVVIHSATAIPTQVKTTPADWAMNDRIRRDGTKALARCAELIGARLYLQQSIVWVARPHDPSTFDEESPIVPRPLYQSAADSELIAREAGARAGFTTAILRCGAFYSADAAHTRMMGEQLTKRKFPIIGKGDAVWSNIHADDAASAFVAATESAKPGLWHVVDDQPATIAEVLNYMARALGAPPPRHVPRWVAALLAGKGAVEFLTASTRTTNAKIRRDLGWAPRFPSFTSGVDQVVTEWRAEGFPRK
ncbi:MAG: NAD-dependent epimerase/dehydratase family protein [Terriglobia bacterium]